MRHHHPPPAPPPRPALRRRGLLALSAAGLACPSALRAQASWPSQPVRMVVPYGAGGSTDLVMRILAPRMSEFLGKPVVVENRPGAGSTMGTEFVAKSTDGHSFVHATLASTGVAQALYANLAYDPVKDLAAIAPTVFVPLALAITTAGWSVRSPAQLIETLRAHPGRYQYGSNGVGSTGHLANANFATRIGAQVEHVPYRAGSQTINALITGEIQFVQDVYGLLLPYHQSGQARCLFVTSEERSPLLPDVPTMTEAGVPPYKAYSWFGLFGPSSTPRSVVDRMSAAVAFAMADPAIDRKMEEMGTPVMRGWSPDRFAVYVASEVKEWAPLVRASGARAD
ncbi:Tripartite-type tricarboxylate transporter, receptor component TctC [Roseomonas rosea]|uniref:Tripartite-type tricarboxylate transporter, receptor component TctC n=1 Tax=Muricoccus roseus TaxID=198092 RepID=A0A1M6LGP5_9PROT|nr:tripartite tricarboxylate transporter substrate-binding protein [Roseomonas rosea]SHJ70360.1 Tripartite-type tricarboxylate transporter, receptor component TctC [Roseomonas rosea]